MASKRSPLTRRQLRQIGLDNKAPAVRDLLWEIHRLRTIALQAEQGCDGDSIGRRRENAVEFTLYPVEDDDSAVEFEAELMVKEASANGCLIRAGGWVRFLPNRVEMADRRRMASPSTPRSDTNPCLCRRGIEAADVDRGSLHTPRPFRQPIRDFDDRVSSEGWTDRA